LKIILPIVALLPNLLLSQTKLDTVKVYDGFEITYLTKKDTVMISPRKWNDIISILKSNKEESDLYVKLQKKYNNLAAIHESELSEKDKIISSYKEMSDMYKQGLDYSVKQLNVINNSVNDSVVKTERQIKRSIFNGVVIGVVSGFIGGIITTAIILK
jgi:hypothetical protein